MRTDYFVAFARDEGVQGLAAALNRHAQMNSADGFHYALAAQGWLLHFDATLFEPATIERFVAHFERVLSEVCANPDAPLFLISLTSPLEAEALIADFSDSWATAD